MRKTWFFIIGLLLLALSGVAGMEALTPTWGQGALSSEARLHTGTVDDNLYSRALTDGRIRVTNVQFISEERPGPLGRSHPTVYIENITDQSLDVSVYVAVLGRVPSENWHLLACGAYNSFDGYRPHETSQESISLGYSPVLNEDEDWSDLPPDRKRYQIRIYSRER